MERAQLLDQAIAAIESLRMDGAHLHSITNTVAQNFTANVLLACGASVSMTANPEEIGDFAEYADAVHINLGTLDSPRMEAISRLVDLALETGRPTTLDPVKVDRSSLRLDFARELVPSMSLIRGNRDEMSALDVAPTDRVCLVETGTEDTVRQGTQTVVIHNGDPLMDRLIATGCALGALTAVLCTKTSSPFIAGLAGALWFSVAGEVAAERSRGPGSFQPGFLDMLHLVSLDTLKKRAVLT